MTEPSRSELSIYDWIRLAPRQLLDNHAHASMRHLYTGHQAQLPPQWVPSIGNWGRFDPHSPTDEVLNTREPHKAIVKVWGNAYRQFKYRYRLLTGPEFIAWHGPDEWMHAELSYAAHHRVQCSIFARNQTYCPIGVACRQACQDQFDANLPPKYRVGLLPVEMVLYTRIFDQFLTQHVMAYEEWTGWSSAKKKNFWSEGRSDGKPWSIYLAVDEPAVLHLPSYAEGAA